MSTTCSASRRASYLVLRMHVVVASHQPLPAKGYGGPQRVIVALVRGLAALGHRITLLAPPTTRVPEATVVAVPPRKLADPATLAPYVPRDAAIVHTHFPLRSAPGSFAFVQTVHRNLKPGAPSYPNSIFLSRDHARRHNSEVFVYNGLDPADYVFRRFPRRPSQYDLFLGALHSAKGYHWAVEAAKRTGHRLIVAGGWRPSFTGSIKLVGEVDGTTKAALLARARCLWNPAAWDEPFGLVTIEAFFSGTPVLGTHRGALPELITPEVGALCDTVDDMIAAAESLHTRNPAACRARGGRPGGGGFAGRSAVPGIRLAPLRERPGRHHALSLPAPLPTTRRPERVDAPGQHGRRTTRRCSNNLCERRPRTSSWHPRVRAQRRPPG